jgi:hypothetical protein
VRGRGGDGAGGAGAGGRDSQSKLARRAVVITMRRRPGMEAWHAQAMRRAGREQVERLCCVCVAQHAMLSDAAARALALGRGSRPDADDYR